MATKTNLAEGVGIILISKNLQGVWMNRRLEGVHAPAGHLVEPLVVFGPNESPRQAAARELFEETHIKTSEDALALVIRGIYKKPCGMEYMSTQFALITDATPENKEPHKHSEWELVPWGSISKKPCFGAVKEIFQTA